MNKTFICLTPCIDFDTFFACIFGSIESMLPNRDSHLFVVLVCYAHFEGLEAAMINVLSSLEGCCQEEFGVDISLPDTCSPFW